MDLPVYIDHDPIRNSQLMCRHTMEKPERFKHKQDPEFFAGACMMATQAIREFYAQGSTTMLLEMLHRLIIFTSHSHQPPFFFSLCLPS